jgi:glycosyltransferase involved in cell wall biosynthesis
MPPSVSVVLPCLDEIATVGQTVREACAALAGAGVDGEVIVADNGSTDGSRQAAAEAGARVVSVAKRGYGAAYLGGFAAARGDVIVMADADATYDLAAIGPMLERIRAGDDLVMGSRLKGRIEPGAMPALHRYVGTPLLTWLLNVLYRTGVSDTQCGMRAFRRDVLPRLRLRMPGMEFASEMIVNASTARLRVSEVPVDYRARRGESKLNTLRDGWRHLRFLLIYSPTALFLVPGLILFALGLLLVLALLPGPLHVAGYFLDIHWMVLGSLFALVGFQIVALGLAAKALAVALEIQPIDSTLASFRRVFTLERGLAFGGLLFLAGLVVDVWIAARWFASGLGALNEVRPALFSLTAMLLGMQLAFASFFVSAIDLHASEPE